MFNRIVQLTLVRRWSVIPRLRRCGGAEFSFALLLAASALLMTIDSPEN